MAETKDLAQALEEMKSKAPEVYNEIIGRYNQSELLNNEALFNDFVKLYDQSVADRKKGQQVLDAAIEANSSEEQTPPNTQDDRTPIENTQALEDPYHWEEFYAPAPEVESKRFDEAYNLLNSEEGKKFQQTKEWTSYNFNIPDSDNKTLDETLNLCACRRIASSNEAITLTNINDARAEESSRIKVEYYNSLFAIENKESYNLISAEKHLSRVLKIDQAVREGKSEQEIFKMLSINPREETKKAAYNTILHSNTQPISNFVEKRKTFRKTMHSFGKVMDFLQQKEQQYPVLAFAANLWLAGNPVYMGYRSVLSARALYNDFQGFKDYAVFSELYKNQISEQGFKRWQEQNKESKVAKNDYDQVKKYDSYSAYLEKHSVNHISEEEFNQIKKFQKKQEFTREEFDMLRQAGGNYEDYAAQFKEKAVSKELYDSIGKYADIRRAQDYEEYAKKTGDRAVSEQEYNQVKVLMRSVGKVSMSQALKDKSTRKAMMAHSVIFVRSLPVVGKAYALGMAANKMMQKSYWQGIKVKAQGTGKAVQTLWSKRGRDREAWKQLRKDGGALLAEGLGVGMLLLGTRNLVENGNNFINNAGATDQNATTLAAAEIQEDVRETPQVQNMPNNLVNTPETLYRETINTVDSTASFENTARDSLAQPNGVETLRDTVMPNAAMMADSTGVNYPGVNQAAVDSTGVNYPGVNQAAVDSTGVNYPGVNQAAVDSTALNADANMAQNAMPLADKAQDNFNQTDFNQQSLWQNPGQSFMNNQTDDVQVPYAPAEVNDNANANDTLSSPVSPAPQFELNDAQKANLESLFKMYPRAATLILEGNENPNVNDVTHGGFSIEGENKLYSNGVISSAKLQELFDNGKFSTEQMQSLSQFADANFENGKMETSLLNDLYGRTTEQSSTKMPEDMTNTGTVLSGTENTGTEQPTASDTNITTYSFDKDGNIIYQVDDLQSMAGMNADDYDAKIYQDLLRREAAGETLDAGAQKFMDSYKASHPDVVQETVTKETTVQSKDEAQSSQSIAEEKTENQSVQEQASENNLQRRELGKGKYELYGSMEINGKMVDVSNVYDKHGDPTFSQYTVHEGEGQSTVVKMEMKNGMVHTTVTEINGEHSTTKEYDGNANKILKDVLGERQTGQATQGLEESKRLDESSQEQHVAAETDKVRSSTFRGKYWFENDANGNPQLHCRMADPQQIPVDKELVHSFQNTIRGSGNHYYALGGLLQADNYGAEHRDNPSTSGIMIKCEYLAQKFAYYEAVYQDMENRLAHGETLSETDLKWRDNYESDMEKVGLTRDDGKLIYSPEYRHADILERGTPESTVENTSNQTLSEEKSDHAVDADRKVYHLNEGDNKPTETEPKGQETTETKSEKTTEIKPEKTTETKSEETTEAKSENSEATKGKTTEYVFEGKIENGVLMQGDEPVHGGPNSAPDLVSTDELTGGKIFQNEQGLYVTENGAFTSYDLNVLENIVDMTQMQLNLDIEHNHDLNMRVAAGETLSAEEAAWQESHKALLAHYGLGYDENGQIEKLHNDAEQDNQNETSSEDKAAESIRSEAKMRKVDNDNFNGKYKIKEADNEAGYDLKYRGDTKVDETILNAVNHEANIEDKDRAEMSSEEKMASARAHAKAIRITREEAVYADLQEESKTRDLSEAEIKFMNAHDKELSDTGLRRDDNGDIVRSQDKTIQSQKMVDKGREY